MGFCVEMVVRRTPEKGTGGSGEGGATRGQGNFELNSHARSACYTMNKTGVASGSFSQKDIVSYVSVLHRK